VGLAGDKRTTFMTDPRTVRVNLDRRARGAGGATASEEPKIAASADGLFEWAKRKEQQIRV
jgi:hypothetical protein